MEVNGDQYGEMGFSKATDFYSPHKTGMGIDTNGGMDAIKPYIMINLLLRMAPFTNIDYL